MKNTVLTLLGACLLSWGLPASAQKPAPHLDNDMLKFFSGNWKGEGAFANGRPIAATLVFRPSLDSAWLVCEHRDVAPNRYKADLYWGVDGATGKVVAYAFDNFHGHRMFNTDGWMDGNLVLQRQAEAPGVGVYYERFKYQRLSDDSFRMAYSTSRDGVGWMTGDSLVFKRQ